MKKHRKAVRLTSKFAQIVGLMVLTFIASTGSAQEQRLKFSKVAGTNGISLGKINNMAKDKYGFMWFSDQSNRSIIRYDGVQMKRFKNDPSDPNSLGGYYPECLLKHLEVNWQWKDRMVCRQPSYLHYPKDEAQENLSSMKIHVFIRIYQSNPVYSAICE